MSLFTDYRTLLFVVGAAMVLMFFARYLQRANRKTAEQIRQIRPTPEQMTVVSHNLDSPASMAKWEVQLHDQARDVLGQIDSKIAVLNNLIRKAEEHIVRLESAISQASRMHPPSRHERTLAAATPASSGAMPSLAANDTRASEIYDLADAGHSSAEIAARTGCPQGEVELILSLRGG